MPKKTRGIKVTDRKKAWLRKSSPSVYNIETKDPYKTILIVTEGQTEKLYFESFEVLTLTVETVDLQGQTKLRLIETTDNLLANGSTDYDEVWCIFDMDVKQGAKEFADFDNAIKSGQTKGFKIGYSNDCFELWFYLHYHYTDQKHHRSFYYKALGKKWNCNYEKNGKSFDFCSNIYSTLEQDKDASQDDAIQRAKKLYREQSELKYHEQNPIAMVYQLVELLNLHARR